MAADSLRLPIPRLRDALGTIAIGDGAQERRVFASVRERGVPVSAFGIGADGCLDAALGPALAARAARDANDPWRRSSPVLLPPGQFYTTKTLTADFSTATEEGVDHLTLEGAGSGQTMVSWRGAGAPFLSYVGGVGVSLHAQMRIAGLLMTNNGAGANTAFRIAKAAFAQFDDVLTQGFDLHWDLTDILSSRFASCRWRGGRRGLWARRGTVSYPNALTLVQCVGGALDEWSEVLDGPATYARIGGSVEGNGLSSAYTVRGGVLLNQPGAEGNVGAEFLGVYFEGNAGIADLLVDGVSGRGATTVNVRSSFNLVGASAVPSYSVYARTGASDPSLIVNVAGSGFGHFNDYAPSADRPYFAATGQARIVGANACSYASGVQRPQGVLNAFASCILDGRQPNPVNGYTNNFICNVAGITKNGTGDFTITFRARGAAPYQVSALYLATTPGLLPPVILAEDAGSVRLQFFNVAGNLTDPVVRLRID